MIPTFYQLICDYGIGDPAFAEVIQRFKQFAPYSYINTISVPPFSTIATGFWIAQLTLYNPSENVIIFSNTAPRHDDHMPRKGNEGEKFVYVELKNGVKIGVVNAGYALSFIKARVKKFHKVQTMENGSQFRSRDYYPQALVETLNGKRELGESIDTSNIPDIPTNQIAFIDGYGNIKTTITKSKVDFSVGSHLAVTINNCTHPAVFTDGIFEVNSGEFTLAPGSSGDPLNPFLEIVLRRGSAVDPSASDIFNSPPVESEIFLKLL